LSQRTRAISDRISAIESDLPVKPNTLLKLTRRKQVAKLTFAVLAGVGGMLAIRRLVRPRPDEYREGVERISGAIAREITKGLKKGASADEAVRRAMSKRPPIVQVGGSDSGGFWRTLMNQTTRQVVAALAPELIDELRFYLGSKRRRNSTDEKEKN